MLKIVAIYNTFTGLSSQKNGKNLLRKTLSHQNPMKKLIQIYLLRIRAAFVPPKPKEFVMAILTSVFRAMFGT